MRSIFSNPIFELVIAGIVIAALASGSMYICANLFEEFYLLALKKGDTALVERIQLQMVFGAVFNLVVVYFLHKLYSALFLSGARLNGMSANREPIIRSALNKVMFGSCIFGMASVLSVFTLKFWR
ncbi:hypothetical protein ACR3H8_30080 [Pseudomonas aeruginosa]|uniref:Uncharacterized protein n=5 Tax=Pseudomonas TaxID=286 RepID=A0A223Q4A2_PSEPU|nr:MULTISPECIES: hypothetical protein [Pseudomonas]WQN30295.1 hypothetical protein ULE26_22255 [Stutzerimonas stutzeri]AJA17205.1 hypothetical protein RPPX_28175 [Pseudomonas putida S12]ANI18855.1 hypothetical protein A9C11_32905 [Pseudomonas citronellolis]ANP63390.1 hypothetical protein A9P90_31545 [Pseudomonas aeruginosa]ARD70469.1 Hypothetical protein [Pseudomonas aeruginosa]